MRACIATGDYFRPGETFVNRHIEHLFGGSTCVVTGRFHNKNPLGKPVFERRKRAPGGVDLIAAPYWLARNTLVHGTSRVPFGRAKEELATFLKDNQVRVILSEFGTQALAIYPLGQELGLPVFTYFRGTDASKHLQRPRIQRAYRKMMPHLAGVFSVSQFLLDNLAAHGIQHPNAHVVPSGVDVRRFVPAHKRPSSCLALGRFVEKKAPLVTLRAFADVAETRSDAYLEMIGDGPLLQEAKRLAASLGLEKRVSLPGALPHDAVRERLASAEIFVQHSITAADGNTEGLPTAIQEALACGCRIVSTRHAGIPEAVAEGETGWLVDEHDAKGFAVALGAALDTELGAEMAAASRKVAMDRFDNDRLLTHVENVLQAA